MQYSVAKNHARFLTEVLLDNGSFYTHPEAFILELLHQSLQVITVLWYVEEFFSHYNNHYTACKSNRNEKKIQKTKSTKKSEEPCFTLHLDNIFNKES